MNVINHLLGYIERNFKLKNDLQDFSDDFVLEKINLNAQSSMSYIILLIASTVVCTLGLLQDSSPVVIGGMIISPLMWPLMKLTVGITYERKKLISQSIRLFLISLGISLFTSFIITYFSPIKVLSTEIVSRTNPTLLDLIIALSAGAVAAFAIIEKKISDSLAGVAIAISLMPPLCVSGVGLALKNAEVFSGSFILFFSNVISIIFISILIYNMVGLRHKTRLELQKKGILLVTGILIITSIPLFILLKDYTFQSSIYETSKFIIDEHMKNISEGIKITNIRTKVDKNINGRQVLITADILIPESVVIDYQAQDDLVAQLRLALESNVDIELNIQRSLSIVSKEVEQDIFIKSKIQELTRKELNNINSKIKISTMDVMQKDEIWSVSLVLRLDPSIRFSHNDKDILQQQIESEVGYPINFDITLIPVVDLKSSNTYLLDDIKGDIETFLKVSLPEVQLVAIEASEKSYVEDIEDPYASIKTKVIVSLELATPLDIQYDFKLFDDLKNELVKKYEKELDLKLTVFNVDIYSF